MPRCPTAEEYCKYGISAAGLRHFYKAHDHAIAGLTIATVANTIADPSVAAPIYAQPIDPPTLAMTFSVNDSPMAGREGKQLTSRVIRDRLMKELDRNVALRVDETDNADTYEVSGRGQLHLSVLVETMRREGFEYMDLGDFEVDHSAGFGEVIHGGKCSRP
jgi:predicted membrane GTPase involved in stress response